MAELYNVVSTHETTELTPADRSRTCWRSPRSRPSPAATPPIRVPVSQATPENVRRLLDARFDSLHAIHEI
jgi:hypothetical protein